MRVCYKINSNVTSFTSKRLIICKTQYDFQKKERMLDILEGQILVFLKKKNWEIDIGFILFYLYIYIIDLDTCILPKYSNGV